ncbi:hypothetical protein PENSTE_c017G03406 [Penicillium steckii]|uniref:Zn(2)-C6 fungal-type domain-containing protein n=1 Tax=Penicillium steckii TaxID=303698 RepID=A0A1V6SXJ1_9EURO|nr:hypothetical protein PENSTE_c017G03406 [Penicillium steckii]
MPSPIIPPRRKRVTFSCSECRRRKLRCDRNQPCSRCKGQSIDCTYDNPASNQKRRIIDNQQSNNEHQSDTPVSLNTIVTTPQPAFTQSAAIRNTTLEAPQSQGTWGLLGQQIEVPSETAVRERPALMSDSIQLLEPAKPRKVENVIFRGKNFKTQFYGGSNPTSLIGDFPELRSFMQDSIKQHPSLPRVQRELKSLQMKWKAEKRLIFPPKHMDFLHYFPDEAIVKRLIEIYIDTVETTYRIVHIPSFWKEYNEYHLDKRSARPAFLILTLLMMSISSCLSEEKTTHVGDSAVARERAALWIEISEQWLRTQSQKHIHLITWQIRCLLLLSKQVNVIKKKRIWTEAGTLLRQAMAAGFHRDPTILGEKVSTFDQEMRRRLWNTITELELQVSIDRGMPSALAGVSSDCATVRNINDEDLTDENYGEVQSNDWNSYTQCSYIHVSASSFALRASLNSLVNNLGPPLQWEQVIECEDLLKAELEKLPSWTRDTSGNQSERLPATLLRIQLEQFLILLHMPFARKMGSSSRCAVSRMICFQAARRILEQVQCLKDHAYFLVILLRQDYFRAALAVCHSGYMASTDPGDLFLSYIEPFIKYLDNCLVVFQDRITRLGTDFTRFWYISAARSLLYSTLNPSNETREKQQAIELVARQYYRIRGSQDDLISVKEQLNLTVSPLIEDSTTIPNLYGIGYGDESLEPIDFPLESLEEEFFFGDPAAWTFENFGLI